VANIYKYYLAYRMASELQQQRGQAAPKKAPATPR
jgi:hypothetical protein